MTDRRPAEGANGAGFYRRYAEVLVALLPFAVAFLRDWRRFFLFGGPRALPDQVHRERARRLTETLLALGPAFIKAGQVLSTRPDLVPPIYAEALGTLQDEVPESEGADPVDVIRTELGDGVLDLDTLEPIAGGSLAFVYTADRTDSGERVAVKVRRPGIKEGIERDLRVIRRLVPVVSVFAPERHQYSLRNVADDFEEIILDELNFQREARMMERISANLANDERVHVPWADTEVSTERVLVMEYVEGVKITDAEVLDERGIDRPELASRVADVYLRMGLEDGVFHADPHPGNLAVDDEARLVIYDFGMCEELSAREQALIRDLYVSLTRRDVDGLIDALVALDVLEPTVDRREVKQVMELAIQSLAGQPQVTWRDIFAELTFSLRDFPFRIPPDVMLLIRVGTVGEGVCRSLDPEFDFLAAVRSHLVREGHVERELRSVLRESGEELLFSLPTLSRLPRRLDAALERIEQDELAVRTHREPETPGSADTGYAILAAGLFVTAGLVFPHSATGAAVAAGAGAIFLIGFILAQVTG